MRGGAVGRKVRQQQILVRRAVRAVQQTLIQVLIADAVPEAGFQLIQHPVQHRIPGIQQMGVIALAQAGGLVGGEAKEEHILVPQHLVHLHVGAVQGA